MKRLVIRLTLIGIFLLLFSSCRSMPELPSELLKKPDIKNAKYLAFPAPCKSHGIHFVHIWYNEKTHKINGYVKPKKHAHIVYVKIDGCPSGSRIVKFTSTLAQLILPLFIGTNHKYRLKGGMLIYAEKKQ